MGGFFLVSTAGGRDRTAALAELRGGFAALGFAPPQTIETEGYILALYPSIETKSLAFECRPDGDFVFVCGTCLGGGEIGAMAAKRLSACGAATQGSQDAVLGHYAAVLRRGDRTEIKLDRFGGFHLFYNLDAGIVSSSFLALAAALGRLTLSQQSACEYVFNGVVSGNETLFSEVAVAPIGGTIRVGPNGLEIDRPALCVPRRFASASRDEALADSMALLDRWFAAAARAFGDRVECALSGGYDSRLILACLRRHSVQPRVYVYGRSTDEDVALAGEIARNEGFEIAHIDKSDRPRIPPPEFPETAQRNFLAQDGYGWGGIFENDSEIAERARRVRGDALAINGGGGEIFRNFFYLPDRQYTIRELLWSFYGRFDPQVCTAAFDAGAYYRGLERKVRDLLGSDEPHLPRPSVEWLYHAFRCRSWDGKVDSICARYGYTGMPYLEPATTAQASALPLAWKKHGAYEAELIRRADHRLAAYPSAYGHDFSGPPPLSRRLRDYATYLRPPWLRRYSYRLRYRRRRAGEWPNYLAPAYQEAVLPGGATEMRRLFRLERVADPEQLARILSLEYALRQFGSRVRLEF